MKDRKGKNVDVNYRVCVYRGDEVLLPSATVRSVAMVGETYEAWVDDGDPAVADPRRNRMRRRMKVRSGDIEVTYRPPIGGLAP